MYAQDINGDGKMDLVCATYTAASGTPANTTPSISVSVLLGNGDGTFKSAITTAIGTTATLTQSAATLAFDDFNGDGKLDVVSLFGLITGNGDGTFSKPTPLPYKGVAPGVVTLPSAPIFATGDFNGDSNVDLATLPATGNTGQVEIFQGNGKGAFTDAGPITVGTNVTITALDADFLSTTAAVPDLIAGVLNSPGTQTGLANIAVLTNNGTGTFATPTLYPVSGPPVSITVADFNGDSNPDLLSINGVAGSTTSTGLTLAATASVLLNKQAALVAPALALRTSANPAVDGNTVKYTATVQTNPAGTTTATPTGVVTFFNGTTQLGTATLSGGKATFTTTAAGVGVQSITFTYGGDTNYATATSAALLQTVLATGAKVPLLLPTLNAAITLPAIFLRGDTGTATITITNGGAAAANGKIDVNFYLSQSGLIDSAAIPVGVPALQNHAVKIASGASISLTAKLRVGPVAPEGYFLVGGDTRRQVDGGRSLLHTPGQHDDISSRRPGLRHGRHTQKSEHQSRRCQRRGRHLLPHRSRHRHHHANQRANQYFCYGNNHRQPAHHRQPRRVHAEQRDRRQCAEFLHRFPHHPCRHPESSRRRQPTLSLLHRPLVAGQPTPTLRVGSSTFKSTLSVGYVGNLALIASSPIGTLSARTWTNGSIDAPSIITLNDKGNFSADLRTHAGGK